ncbi:hypothetical protein KR018_011707 [Drosophila ironensis]|nr:hypothetical protein KR018_011707 [Drosophila ironensis]
MFRRSCLVFTLLGICLVCNEARLVDGHVLVYRRLTNQANEFNAMPAQFGPSLSANGIKVFVVPAMPLAYGCDRLSRPPQLNYPHASKFVALISRGGECTFERKVRVAQNASYSAVIVYNNDGDDLEQMSADNTTGIHIPSVFVGLSTGKALASYFTPEVVLIINDELPFNINTQLILPFSILIGLCFIIMVIYMIYKCIREQRRHRRHRLPKSMLKKLPVLRYTKNNVNNKYDTCVICLEDFVEDDKLRVLPCSHPYHTHCIDPWLTENRRVCPICKRKVFTKGEPRASRSRQPYLDNVTDTDDDTTPLLQQQQSSDGRQAPQASAASSAATAAAGSSSSVATTAAAGTTRHGTFRRADAGRNPFEESQSSDEENALLDSAVRPATSSGSARNERINPFDRAPNLPANLAEQLDGGRPSIWSKINFGFLFRRQPTAISVAAPPFLEHVESGGNGLGLPVTGTIAVATPASNNILNPNLSGSFKDDDEMPPHRSIYEPIAISTPGTDDDSAFLQTPTQGGIGVAALPHSSSDRQFLI